MIDIDLKPDEYVVMKSEHVRHGRPNSSLRASSGSYKDDLVLTNQRIVWISRGVFGNAKKAQSFALGAIKVIDGRPQAIADGDYLEVYLINQQESFGFLRKSDVRAWAHNVAKLLTGSSGSFRGAQNKAIPGAAYVADTLKDTLDTFKDSFKLRSRTADKRVAQECKSCGASMSGIAGGVVQCKYCNTDQVLRSES